VVKIDLLILESMRIRRDFVCEYVGKREQTADVIATPSRRIYRYLFMYPAIRGADINDNTRDKESTG